MIGTCIKDLMLQRGMTLTELARHCEVSATTLHSIVKRDNSTMDLQLLFKICKALDVPIEYFLNALGGKTQELPSLEEWELLRQFRGLDGHGREMALVVISAELERVAAGEKQAVRE